MVKFSAAKYANEGDVDRGADDDMDVEDDKDAVVGKDWPLFECSCCRGWPRENLRRSLAKKEPLHVIGRAEFKVPAVTVYSKQLLWSFCSHF